MSPLQFNDCFHERINSLRQFGIFCNLSKVKPFICQKCSEDDKNTKEKH